MTDDTVGAFLATAEVARAGAGVIAARHRGDLASVDTLLAGVDDRARAARFLFLADLAVALLAQAEGRPVGDVAADLSLQIAAHLSGI